MGSEPGLEGRRWGWHGREVGRWGGLTGRRLAPTLPDDSEGSSVSSSWPWVPRTCVCRGIPTSFGFLLNASNAFVPPTLGVGDPEGHHRLVSRRGRLSEFERALFEI